MQVEAIEIENYNFANMTLKDLNKYLKNLNMTIVSRLKNIIENPKFGMPAELQDGGGGARRKRTRCRRPQMGRRRTRAHGRKNSR